MSETTSTNIAYLSFSHATEKNWDCFQLVQQYKDTAGNVTRPADYLTLARRPDGTILRRTNIAPEVWEIITDEEQLKFAKEKFDTRDRLAAEQRERKASA
jgi:hypothetical protein